MEEKKSIRLKHSLASKGYVGPVVIGVLSQFFIISLLSGMIADFLPAFFDEYHIVELGLSILALIFFKFWFRPEYKGSIAFGNWDNKLIVAILIVCIIDVLSVALTGEFSWENFNLETLLMAVAIGFNEETFLRIIPIALMCRNKNSQKNIMKIIIISAVVFGMMHLPNMFMGASVGVTILQIVTSTCSGLFYGAMFMYTGSFIPSVAAHAIHDFICSLDVSSNASDGTMVANLTGDIFIEEGITIVIKILFTLYILRPVVREAIEKLWEYKWSKEG